MNPFGLQRLSAPSSSLPVSPPEPDRRSGFGPRNVWLALALLLLGLGIIIAVTFDEEATLLSAARHFLRNLVRALF